MTAQEVFDQVVTHLRTQKETSTRKVKHHKFDEIEAALRGDEGRKCPAGLLITDEEYMPVMEGIAFTSILRMKEAPQSLKDRCQEHATLIEALQYLHDFTPVAEWETALATTATNFAIKYTAP